MAGRADIACAEDGLRSGLPLDGKHPLLGVGSAVVDVVAGNAADRFIGAPVDIRVRVAARGIQRGKRVGEGLAVILSVGRGDKWRREQRRRGAGVRRAIRRVGGQHADGERSIAV